MNFKKPVIIAVCLIASYTYDSVTDKENIPTELNNSQLKLLAKNYKESSVPIPF